MSSSTETMPGKEREELSEGKSESLDISKELEAFRLAHPDCEEEVVSHGLGWYDFDGYDDETPIRQLVAIGPDGKEIRSPRYF